MRGRVRGSGEVSKTWGMGVLWESKCLAGYPKEGISPTSPSELSILFLASAKQIWQPGAKGLMHVFLQRSLGEYNGVEKRE